MAEKVTLEILTKLAGVSGDSSKGSSSKSKGGIFGAVSAIAGIGLGVAGVLALLKDMFWSLKPLLSLISSIAKMLGMFLQPIAETIMLLLVPILTLLRPIVQAFNVMLAPVMSLIRELGAIANQQAASGDMSGLMQTSALMIQTLFSGFFIVMADIIGPMLFNLADTIGTFLIGAFYDLGILFAGGIDTIFGTNLAEGLQEQKTNALNILHNGIDIMTDTLHNGTSIMLENLIYNVSTKIEELGGTLPGLLSTNVVAPFEDLVKELSAVVKRKSSRTPSIRETYDEGVQQSTYYGGTTAGSIFDPTAPGGILNPI